MQFALCVGLMAGLTGIAEAQPQESPDLDVSIRDLRQTLTDLDDRLRRIEQLVKEVSRASTKSANRWSPAMPSSLPVASAAALPNVTLSREAYQRGRVAEERQHYEPAIEAFAKAVQLDPGNDAAFLHRGRAYFQLGDFALALSDLNQSLVIQPNNARAYELRANIKRALKAYDSAIADLGHALEHDPGNSSYLLSEAGIAEERGDFAKALEVCGRSLLLNPNSSETHLLRASVFGKLNQTDRALQECAAAVELHPSEAQGYICRADAYVRLGQLPQAITDVNRAIRLNPMVSEAGNVISAVRQKMLLRVEARELRAASRSKAAGLGPRADTPARPSIGRVAEAEVPAPSRTSPTAGQVPTEKRPGGAVDSVLPARQARYYTTKGRAYTLEARYEDAIESLTTAVERDPSYAVAYNSRGYAYLRTGNYGPAISDFTSAIHLDATYANAYLNRGVARRLAGDTVGAQEDIERAALFQKTQNALSSAAHSPGTPQTRP